jgi:hypothetical protein
MGLWRPIGDVKICRIFANRAIIGHILHRNRKEGFFRVFRYWPGTVNGKLGLNWAYFPSGVGPSKEE